MLDNKWINEEGGKLEEKEEEDEEGEESDKEEEDKFEKSYLPTTN